MAQWLNHKEWASGPLKPCEIPGGCDFMSVIPASEEGDRQTPEKADQEDPWGLSVSSGFD